MENIIDDLNSFEEYETEQERRFHRLHKRQYLAEREAEDMEELQYEG